MAVFTLEDAQGGVEVDRVSRDLSAQRGLIETGTLVLVRGKLERDDESVRILATEIAPLDSVRERLAREVVDSPQDAGRSRRVRGARRDLLAPPRRPARLVRDRAAGEPPHRLRVRADVSSQIRVRPSPALDRGGRAGRRRGAVELR